MLKWRRNNIIIIIKPTSCVRRKQWLPCLARLTFPFAAWGFNGLASQKKHSRRLRRTSRTTELEEQQRESSAVQCQIAQEYARPSVGQ